MPREKRQNSNTPGASHEEGASQQEGVQPCPLCGASKDIYTPLYTANLELTLRETGQAQSLIISERLMLKAKVIADRENVKLKAVVGQFLAAGISKWEEKNSVIEDKAMEPYKRRPFKDKIILP